MRAAANGADLPLWGHSRAVICTVLGHTICWCHGPLGSLQLPVIFQGQRHSGFLERRRETNRDRVLPRAAQSRPSTRGEGGGAGGWDCAHQRSACWEGADRVGIRWPEGGRWGGYAAVTGRAHVAGSALSSWLHLFPLSIHRERSASPPNIALSRARH